MEKKSPCFRADTYMVLNDTLSHALSRSYIQVNSIVCLLQLVIALHSFKLKAFLTLLPLLVNCIPTKTSLSLKHGSTAIVSWPFVQCCKSTFSFLESGFHDTGRRCYSFSNAMSPCQVRWMRLWIFF